LTVFQAWHNWFLAEHQLVTDRQTDKTRDDSISRSIQRFTVRYCFVTETNKLTSYCVVCRNYKFWELKVALLCCSLAALYCGLATQRTYLLHLSLSSIIRTDSSMESPVHVLMLSIQAVRGLPRLRAPGMSECVCVMCWQVLALSLSPGNSLVCSWCDQSMLASLLWRCLAVPSLLQLC